MDWWRDIRRRRLLHIIEVLIFQLSYSIVQNLGKKAIKYKLSLYISHLELIHKTSFWAVELNMRSSSTRSTLREERRKRVSQPHNYSHLNLSSLWDRTANKPPGNFPTVENHRPSCTSHLTLVLWERSNASLTA